MISLLSKRISNFLCKICIIEKNEVTLYQYGFEIIISTLIGFMITVVIGGLFHMLLYSLLYYIIFVFLRLYTGGFHANTYLMCNLVYLVIAVSVLGISKVAIVTNKYPLIVHILIILTSVFTVIWLAPIENKNKPLSVKKRERNKKISIASIIVLSIFACIMFFLMKSIAIVTTFTLLAISVLIVASTDEKGGECNE